MDKIIMKDLRFYGYHGILEEEKALGQKFFVDAILFVPLKTAGEADDLSYSVSYAEVYGTIKDIVTNEKFLLIEGLAERIVKEIFSTYTTIQKILLRIKKPEAPVPGIFEYFGVEIERSREEYE